MELILLLICAFSVRLVFSKSKWLRWTFPIKVIGLTMSNGWSPCPARTKCATWSPATKPRSR